MFFILCWYIEHVYIYLYRYWKIVTKILMGFIIWCQVGDGGTPFSKLAYVREFSNIWFQTCHFSFCFNWIHPFCRKFQKRYFQWRIEKNLVPNLSPFFLLDSDVLRILYWVLRKVLLMILLNIEHVYIYLYIY